MTIYINYASQEFHLQNNDVSYIFRVLEKTNQLEHLYYGKKVTHQKSYSHLIEREVRTGCNIVEDDHTSSLEHIKQEYPSYGTTDFRYPAHLIKNEHGSHVTSFQFDSYETVPGKPSLENLPATYVDEDEEAETLIITLKDHVLNVRLQLFYCIYTERPVITRHCKFINDSNHIYTLDTAMSMSVDLPDDQFDMLQLNGAWARETHLAAKPLSKGLQAVSSTRGASSHVHNPFLALKRPDTNEHSGEVYGFSLVYSGNFLAQIEVDNYDVSRVMLGINPFCFAWKLAAGQSFQTPECVMVYSSQGLNAMSQAFHTLYRDRLARGYWRDRTRPVLINNWEATYFNFNEEKVLDIATTAKDLGIELFVLDDGWFGERHDDSSSLGDWFENKDKLPNGISGLAEKIEALGMKFGLWFEPEMVSKGTKLFDQHPDWIIATPERTPSHGRNQYVLDFSRQEVVDHIYKLMDDVIGSANISYIKWDMNRYITEAYSSALPSDQQGEVFHRYILGVYQLYERLIKKYPEILFESCAGGGARFDPGMLYYAPQTWASDDTDAVERLKIQYGASMVYPLSAIGSHVSAVPNHQVHRSPSIHTRANVAYFGTFGYELDITKLTNSEQDSIRAQTAFYKEHRSLIRNGHFHRLQSPFDSNETAWMVVAKDKKEALVGYYQVLAKPSERYKRIKLTGLDPNHQYEVKQLNKTYYGDELMNIGLILAEDYTDRTSEYWSRERTGDYHSQLFVIKAV
ncbi:alpha-galactosidase [Amphibacillus marinus]|uniref:Alpha-galactosidase n=1 Tax=Amphibacillus marinus TaxID=872970 RepID=A0A1H8MCI3_9BACI|nr:alpha-galactosidase [Amphibacillus marinus]SEO15039.1 alpha-galactosidase [Amphibacillus marinus]